MNKTYKIIIGILLISVGILFFLVFKNGNPNNVAYVKLGKIYNEFSLKKELESKLIVTKNQRKTILDSLMLQLKLDASQLEQGKSKDEKEIMKFQYQKQNYLTKEKEFGEDSERLATQYSEQIWKQINQYVGDYGKQENFSFIYGANSDGTIMYAKDNFDITDIVIEYVNNRYKGDVK